MPSSLKISIIPCPNGSSRTLCSRLSSEFRSLNLLSAISFFAFEFLFRSLGLLFKTSKD